MRLVIKVMHCLVCVMLVWLHCEVCMAQTNFTSRFWHVTDGLPTEVVQALAQTHDHYLWVGTTSGLLRFDGTRFELFDRSNTAALTAASIFCLTVTSDGTLWIGSEGGGLTRYRDGKFSNYGMRDGLTNNVVRAIREDAQGTVWIGTDEGLFVMSGDRLRRVDGTYAIPQVAVHTIASDRQGGLWVGGSALLRIEHGKARVFRIQGRAETVRIKTILQTSDGTMWTGTVSGLYRMNARGQFMPVRDINRTVRVLRQTSDGTLWIGTIGDGMYTLAPGTTSPVRFLNALANKAILNMLDDIEGNLWIATQTGLERLSRTSVSIVPVADASDSDFGSIFRDDDGTIWMCSTHLERLRNGKFEPYQPVALKGITVRNLLRDRNGTLWAGTEGNGLLRLDAGVKRYSGKNGLAGNYIRALLQTRDGSMWVGTDTGASRITPDRITNVAFTGHVPSVMALLEDRGGDIWLGGFAGLLRLHDGKPLQDELTNAVGRRIVWALHQSPDGTLWVGTNDGLFITHNFKVQHIRSTGGLPLGFIYQILEGVDGRIWLSGPGGVVSFLHSKLDQSGTEDISAIPLMFFDISRDFEPAELFNGIQPAGAITPEGDVWFPSSRGAIHIQAGAATNSQPFPLKIDAVVVDGTRMPSDNTIYMASGSSRLELDYSAILLASQDTVRYRVKLENFDKDWQEVSAGRTAYYTNLPPGHFTFRVAAFRIGDLDDAREVSLTIVKAGPFYERAWFVILCLLVSGALIYGVYRLRLSRVRLRFQTVVEERSRVAREMHDTVIQGCTTISALLEASASMDGTDQDSARELNQLARKQIETTILEARQAVWNLRNGTPIQDDIESAIEKIVQDANEEFGKRVTFMRFGEPFPIIAPVAHELLMVTREAVHNALVHGKPDTVRIQISFSEDRIVITTEDDGSGFDPVAAPRHSPGHFGLQGMYERMNRIGGDLVVDSSPAEGTVVTITVTASSCRDSRTLESV